MPHDKAIFQAANKPGKHNVLHICKDNMADYRFKNFPADVFNWGVFSGGNPPLEAGRELWPGKTLLGGLDDRDGVMVYGRWMKSNNPYSACSIPWAKKNSFWAQTAPCPAISLSSASTRG